MSVFFVTTDYYTMIYTDTVMFKSLKEPLLQNFSIYLGAPFAWLCPVDLAGLVMERAWDGMSGRPGQLEEHWQFTWIRRLRPAPGGSHQCVGCVWLYGGVCWPETVG